MTEITREARPPLRSRGSTFRLGKFAMTTRFAAAVVAGMLRVEQASAQSTTMLSNTELSKEAENPVTLHVTLPLRYEAVFDDGPYRATKSTYEIDQAVVPFALNDDWALITRSKLPAYSQPPKKKGDSWATGFGNGYTTLFLSPTRGPGIYWGVGPVLFYPTATNAALGVNKWGSGVSAAVVKKDQSPWEAGAVINNIWSLGGPPGSSDRYNQMLLNPFLSYHFGNGWSIGTSPNITANWLSKAGQVWTVPVGADLGKVFRIGTLPLRFSLASYYNAVRPNASSETWLMQGTVTFILAR